MGPKTKKIQSAFARFWTHLDSGQYNAFYSIISQTKDNASDLNVAVYSMILPFSLSNFKQVSILSFPLTFIISHQVRYQNVSK